MIVERNPVNVSISAILQSTIFESFAVLISLEKLSENKQIIIPIFFMLLFYLKGEN